MEQARLFLRLFYWFSVRHLLRQPWRVAAVLVGIALGAAVFTSVRLAVHAALDSFTQSVNLIAGKSDWVVTQPGGRVPDHLVATLLRHPAVLNAAPLLTSYVQPAFQGEENAFLLLGLDPILDRPLRTWNLHSSEPTRPGDWLELMTKPFTLFLGQPLANRHHLAVGNRWSLAHVQQRADFRVLAILAGHGLGLVEGGRVALTDLASMQEFTGLQGWVDRIELQLKPSASPPDLEGIRALLPEGVVLQSPEETRQGGRDMIDAYQLNLSVLSFVSLFVGMYLVYSLVALNAASRRRELATMQALGASPRLQFLLFLGEGALLGLLGWCLSLPGSILLSGPVLGRVTATITTLFVRLGEAHLRFSPAELLTSFVGTMVIALLAALQPAREAMAVPPQEALQEHAATPMRARQVGCLALWGCLLIALVWPLGHLPGPRGVPLPGYMATFLLFAGFSLTSPWILHVLGTFLPPLLRRFAGPSTVLAARFLRDAGTRTAISVGALITAMALFVALVIMVHSFRRTVVAWVDQTVSGDVFVRPAMAGSNDYRDALPAEVVANLQSLPQRMDVEVLPYRRIYLKEGTVGYQFEALDVFVHMRHGGFLFLQGNPSTAIEEVAAGRGILASEVFVNRTGKGIGDPYRVTINGIAWDLPIVGVVRDYRTHGGVVFASLTHYQQVSGDQSWNGVRLFVKEHDTNPGHAGEALRQEILTHFAGHHNIEVTLGRELHQEILRIFDETFAITSAMLVIALLVAALGITTTLTVLVLERIRQLQTLVAIGGSYTQIRAMIFWEAIFMVSAGECVGLVCGLMLAQLLNTVINRQSFGWTFIAGIDWPALAASAPFVLLTALLAALPAVRLALRSSPALVLRER
jgi:putative ABC transport system permease protein